MLAAAKVLATSTAWLSCCFQRTTQEQLCRACIKAAFRKVTHVATITANNLSRASNPGTILTCELVCSRHMEEPPQS